MCWIDKKYCLFARAIHRLAPGRGRHALAAALSLALFISGPVLFASTNETIQSSLPQENASPPNEESGKIWRDPFWPIGFVPPAARQGVRQPPAGGSGQGPEKTPALSKLLSMLKIGGIGQIGDKFYVTINGVTVQTGDVVNAVSNGEVYRFIVEKINFNKVLVRPYKGEIR